MTLLVNFGNESFVIYSDDGDKRGQLKKLLQIG